MVAFAVKDPEGWVIEAGVWEEALDFGIVRSSPKWASSLSICSSQSPGNSEGGIVLIVSVTITRCSFGVRSHVTNLRRVASSEPLDGVETERTRDVWVPSINQGVIGLSASEKLGRSLLLNEALTLRHRGCDPFEVAQVRLADQGVHDGSFIQLVRRPLITDEKLGLSS